MLGLRFCARAFSSCGKRGPLFIAVRGPLTIAASLVAEHRLQTRMLSSCGSRAQLLRGMWDLPRPGLEPVSPALAGRFSTTAPPGKPCALFFKNSLSHTYPVTPEAGNHPRMGRLSESSLAQLHSVVGRASAWTPGDPASNSIPRGDLRRVTCSSRAPVSPSETHGPGALSSSLCPYSSDDNTNTWRWEKYSDGFL